MVSQVLPAGEKYHMSSLEQSMRVLLYFKAERPTASLEELHSQLGINKAQLTRMLRTFESMDFIFREGNDYRLGVRVLELSKSFLGAMSLTEAAKSGMVRLAGETRHTVSVALLDGLEIVYVAIEQGRREVGIQTEVGGRHLAHATALGKVLLAALPDEEVRNLYRDQPMQRLTHRTIVSLEELLDSLTQVRRLGYAIDDEERGIGIRCIAAPIRNHEGQVVAGVSIAAPIFHLSMDLIEDRARLVTSAAMEISKRLGLAVGESDAYSVNAS